MLRSFRSVLIVLPLVWGLPAAVHAAKVKVWHHNSPTHYDKAQLKQAVISNEGALRLSHQLKPLAGLQATHVWDVVEDKDGNLFVATGDEGKLYKVTPEGKVSVAFNSEESQILCLALAGDGSVYAGTGPGGLIVRIAPDGKASVLYRTPESYVWSLALDAKGQTLYAGTGPKGRIYHVTPDGKGSLFYATKQEHILCLAMGPDGLLYAGTDKGGLVYRIDAKGKGFVLYSAPQAEVHSLLVTPEGIYAGTSAPSRHHRSTGIAQADRPFGSVGELAVMPVSGTKSQSPAAAKHKEAASSKSLSDEGASESSKGTSASAASPPSTGENSLYRISGDGTVRELFREKVLVLSLLRQKGRIFVGTGMEGQLFEVDEASKERSEVARLDHGQIHCMCRRHDGSIVLGTGDPGKLYVLQDKYAAKGTVVSEVLDAKIISRWGALSWKADTPIGTRVTVAVRSGNVAEPDETWSDWSAEETDPQQATAAAPAARFLQYRVTLATDRDGETPSLHSLAIRYKTTNQAPEVTSLDVPDLDAANLDNPKKLKFKWSATDANEDELTYSLYVRKDGWRHWVLLEENLEKKEYEWDTTTTPSGMYQLKVMASDRKDNPAEEALTGERMSAPFAVAHTPPTVTVKVTGMEGEQAVIEATATDPMVRLTAASFAVNGKKWVNVFPTDGLFDSKTETFRFKTEALKPGTYVLVLRVTDAAGNTGSGDVVFTVQTRAAQK
jgi:sugar lactone lactonase YvrE